MPYTIAGIDVHKKVLMVVVADMSAPEATQKFERRRFGATTSELLALAAWLQERGVKEVVMESTAQYWKPVWLALEPHFQLHLAQAQSNRAPGGRKSDFRDAERLVRRLVADELFLSYVPEPEQRIWRTLTRSKVQLARERVRLQNQIEALLEEGRIKLSSVVSDLLGASGQRMLHALADGQHDASSLAKLGDPRLHASEQELADALNGDLRSAHCEILKLFLKRVELVDEQIAQLDQLAADQLQAHQKAVARLAAVPGLGANSAQQILAEVGPQAQAFPSSEQLCSWVGVCPGRNESAEHNRSGHCAKGNRYLRRILCQGAQAAVKKNGSYLQALFRRLMPRLGYLKAIWTVAHRLCQIIWKILHDGAEFIEYGQLGTDNERKRRTRRLTAQLRKLGYTVQLNPIPSEQGVG
jgi:transposase